MKNQHNNHLLELLLATTLISTSGVLGRYIDLPSPVTIWWRCILGTFFLYLFCRFKKYNLNVRSKKDISRIVLSSILLGAHWITYFYALKLSNVALGMLSLFTFPVITAFIEPIFYKTKLDLVHIFLGLLVILGVYILAPEFNFQSSQVKGVMLGVLSAFCFALRNVLLKGQVIRYNGTVLMTYQILILSFVLLPFVFILGTNNINTQFPYVILLALFTTAIGHSLFIHSFKNFSVSTASIINSLQPVLGIIMAYLILNEIPASNTLIGGSLILATVVIESMRSKKRKV
ncbi:DMT family transporter [Yeosuana sp. MJ-SS3]|uniref:DMT family transporter n=1 Tax=Gilvirhabdus luticola TaxID=3079858 RepID=A0ABU3U3X1_9FLAO|nr:DMT family transporter [Yeosuana sp. MJ-SS3]MDU8885106.1 DMT family transporter [Yeosuana sp. MJ-SS3]